jgi:ketopantoate reductase
MKIAVMGAGAVGCYYGGMLARAGHDVVLIGRPLNTSRRSSVTGSGSKHKPSTNAFASLPAPKGARCRVRNSCCFA